MIIKLLVEGGAMKINPGIAQKLGPLGLNIGKITADVNKATEGFKGMKVPVTLDIDASTKDFTISVSTPPTAELLKKEFSLEKGSGTPGETKVANAAIEIIIKVAKIKQKDMMVNSLKEAVKSVLGSCVSLGILVESQDPKDVSEKVDAGEYNTLIDQGNEVPSKEKLNKLKAYFAKEQAEEAAKKAEEEAAAKAAEEAKAAEAEAPVEGEAPAEGAEEAAPAEGEAAPAEGESPATEAKPEEKKEEKK